MGATVAQAVVVGAANGTVYVMGGTSVIGYTTVATAYSYNPDTGEWRSLAPMLYATRGAAGAMGLDGKVYVIGGSGGSSYTQIYDPDTNSWSLGAAMLDSAWEAKAATVTDGATWGGGGEGVPAGYVQIYDPASDAWSAGTAAPGAVECGALVAVGDDLYYSGGGLGSYIGTTTFYMYDASADTWVTTLQQMPIPRAAHAMVVGVDGLVYLVGGSSDGWNIGADVYSSVMVYDPTTDEWSSAADMNYARKYLGATVTPGGMIVALGGNTLSAVLDTVESLQLYEFQYSVTLSSSTVRAGETVLLTLDAQFTFIDESFSTVTWYLESVTDGTVYNPGSTMIPTDAPAAITITVPALAPPGDYSVVVDWTVYSTGVYEQVLQDLPLEVTAAPEPTDALIADLEAQLAAMWAQLNSSDADIAALQAQLNILMGALATMAAGQTAASAQLNATLVNLQSQLDAFQEQIDRVENKADTAGTYGIVTMILVVIIVVLVALVLMMSRRKAPGPPAP